MESISSKHGSATLLNYLFITNSISLERTSIISGLVSGVTTVLIPLLYSTVGLEFWHLMNLVFLGAWGAFGGTSTDVSRTDRPENLDVSCRLYGITIQDSASSQMIMLLKGHRSIK